MRCGRDVVGDGRRVECAPRSSAFLSFAAATVVFFAVGFFALRGRVVVDLMAAARLPAAAAATVVACDLAAFVVETRRGRVVVVRSILCPFEVAAAALRVPTDWALFATGCGRDDVG